MERWSDYIAALPLYDRCLVAHGNPENFPLIDRAVEKARMELRMAVSVIMADADRRVAELLWGK